jgi:DNA uptake protein ComE-like DNA-binding protein
VVLDLNAATFDQLRGLGMSLTQTNRVLAYRERLGSFRSLQQLDDIPGFPQALLAELKVKLSV